jgi:formylglycine-generating enzyme required for sulfatase activity
MKSWLDDCDELLGMREAIEGTIDSLQKDALPWDEARQQAFEQADPEAFARWQLRGRVATSLRHAQAMRDGARLPAITLTEEQQALDSEALNSLAWARVDPDPKKRTVWGEELLGLATARLAVENAADDPARFQYLDTLAWALLANGQDDEARRTSQAALDAAPADQRQSYEGYLAAITDAVDRAGERLAAAEEVYEERPVWEFAPEGEAQAFLHDTLEGLLGQLDRLASTERGVIAQRIEWARQIEALSLGHPNADVTWSAVRKAIASSDKYAGQTIDLRDRDVLGLVPLEPNPVTGYFEFYHLRSAWDGKSDPREIAIPVHDPKDGSIKVTGETGIVFVLLPGGEVTLGSQGTDADAPYYDAQRKSDEVLHEVTLAPFFLARHELTQGQWARLWSGDASLRRPSSYGLGFRGAGMAAAVNGAHPVEHVDWTMCRDVLGPHGLLLPTEAQWEYGCRGGTTTAWLSALAELSKYANVADATGKRAVPDWQCETWMDGHVGHAPVGSFLANGFGLYDVHGNVCEWCRDWYGAYGTEQPGDGLRPRSSSSDRVTRGGSFNIPAVFVRSAYRFSSAPAIRNDNLGLRPARTSRLRD